MAPTRRAHFIKARGRAALADPNTRIDNAFLKQFDEFLAYQGRSPERDPGDVENIEKQTDITPDEALRSAHRAIIDSLASDLLDRVLQFSPAFFEGILVGLFVGMGYGGSTDEAGRALGRSGDGGVIDQDPLGVDQIYRQTKRYGEGNNIGAGAIRDFFGALSLKRANKGIFVTTSAFSSAAMETARRLGSRIVLIDGPQLARLILKYNIDCRDEEVIHLKRIDEDFFDNLM